MSENVTNFKEILQPYLQNQTISSYKTVNVPERHLLEVEVTLNNGTILYVVAKYQKNQKDDILNITGRNFRKEIAFYSVIFPTLKHFEEKEEMDELYFVPEYYGCKTSNDEGVLLLENLRSKGYKLIEDMTGLDLASTRQVLKDLASFHALSIALKVKDDKIFDIKIKRHLTKETLTAYSQKIVDKIIKILEDDIDKRQLERIKERLEEPPSDKIARAPFSTLIHCQYFIKNIMTKNENSGTPDIKIINFAHCSYGSIAEDLIYFLYTSVDREILEEHIDSLIEFYHSNLVRVIEECKCDPTPFSLDGLLKEMKIVANESQIPHVLFTIYLNVDNEDLSREKLLFAVNDFSRRRWI